MNDSAPRTFVQAFVPGVFPSPDVVTSVSDILVSRALTHGDMQVFRYLKNGEEEVATLTFRQLYRRSSAVARQLRIAAEPGDRALLLYPQGLEYVIAFFACVLAGVVAVPAFLPRKNHKQTRLQAIAGDCRPALVLTGGARPVTNEDVAQFMPSELEPVLINTDQILEPATDTDFEPAPASHSTLAFLQYTSGSTGQPKGVMISHGNILHNVALVAECDRDSHVVSWLPLFHDMGLVSGMLLPVLAGVSATLMSPESFIRKPWCWLDAISRFRGTISGAPNFAFDLCLRRIDAGDRALDLSTWKIAFTGAEPVQHETLEAFAARFCANGFASAALAPLYGMAEATVMISGKDRQSTGMVCKVDPEAFQRGEIRPVSEGAGKVLVKCGAAGAGHEISIVDPESGQPCGDGIIGEIWHRGPSVSAGYWNQPELNQYTFGAMTRYGVGPFLRTGDLGFVSDGELVVTGRLKDLIIVSGRKFYPHDLERVASNADAAFVPGAAIAFAVEVQHREAAVLAIELTRNGMRDGNHQALCQHIASEVQRECELLPARILLLKPASLPRTSSGKVQRKRCRELYDTDALQPVFAWAAAASVASPSRPGSAAAQKPSSREIEHWLLQQLARYSAVAGAAPDAGRALVDYGLDSVAVVQLTGELGDWLQQPLPVSIVFDYPNVAALAAHLAGDAADVAAPVSRLSRDSSIAVVGMAIRVPGADDIAQFWDLLEQGRDACGPWPQERGINTRAPVPAGGFLQDMDLFDASFFGIGAQEAEVMDPQQRLLLELAYAGLQHAGFTMAALRGSDTGVFMGVSQSDYGRRFADVDRSIAAYAASGNATSMVANRLSYLMDWHGPSLSIDTACSSSLVALHEACESLRAGECSMALAGGVNLVLDPAVTAGLASAGMMAADGRCKTFSELADGYGRGEGCGVLLLKPLDQARQDNDRIFGVILGSAVMQDGHSNGLTAPNGKAQERVLTMALQRAGIAAGEVGYMETHGTGTPLGDPVEINALQRVFGSEKRRAALRLGALKANIGHLESAAGIAGVIKALLCVEKGVLPPQINALPLNTHVDWTALALTVNTVRTDWTDIASTGPRVAGVSSFGFGGTLAHMLIRQADPAPQIASAPRSPESHLFVASARNKPALQQYLRLVADVLQAQPDLDLGDLCYSSAMHRDHFSTRLALTAHSIADLRGQLLAQLQLDADLLSNQFPPRDTVFLFSGQGTHLTGSGRDLYGRNRAFTCVIDQAGALLEQQLGVSLPDLLWGQSSHLLQQTEFAQPAIFVLQVGLQAMWQELGITPQCVLGHSVGEFAAAVQAQVMSFEDALALTCARGRLMQQLCAPGAMLSVSDLTVDQVRAQLPADVTIAAFNGHEQLVLAGDHVSIATVAATLTALGGRCRVLETSHGFHSASMQPMLAAFREQMAGVQLQQPKGRWFSSMTGREEKERVATVDYWCEHIIQPVRFAAAAGELLRYAPDLCIEIGPGSALLGLCNRQWSRQQPGSPAPRYVQSLRRNQNDYLHLLHNLKDLYQAGCDPDWSACYSTIPYQRVQLPLYPYQRQRYWVALESATATATAVAKPVEQADLADLFYQVNPEFLPRSVMPGERRTHWVDADWQQAIAIEPESVSAGISVLNEWALHYAVNALQQLGLHLSPSALTACSTLAGKLSTTNRHYGILLDHVIARLVDEKLLQREQGQLRVLDAQRLRTLQLTPQQPAVAHPLLILLQGCGNKLADVLTGRADALDVLFADAAVVQQIYLESRGNVLLKQRFQWLLDLAPPHQVVRVLEIGGGTGGTTAHLLPLCREKGNVVYTFTDISSAFLEPARQRFGSDSFIDYRTFDVTATLEAQDIPAGGFDIVIAANVLHATPDIRQTLAQVHRLLTPGGLLLALEMTVPQLMLDLTFGLTSGWWLCAEDDVRNGYPLMRGEHWLKLFRDLSPALTHCSSTAEHSESVLAFVKACPLPLKKNARWWLLVGAAADAEPLQAAMQQAQCAVTVLEPAPEPQFASAWDSMLRQRGSLPQAVVMLAAASEGSFSPDTIAATLQWTVALSRTVLNHPCAADAVPPQLILVTQQNAGPASPVFDPVQRMLWSFARGLRHEYPFASIRCIDRSPSADCAWLADEIRAAGTEPEVALDQHGRWVSRLAQRAVADTSIALDQDGVYLITGGLGGLGILVAEWLAEQGAADLVLLSRTTTAHVDAMRRVRALQAQGVAVQVLQVDLADQAAVQQTIAALDAEQRILRGLFHCAMVLEDRTLTHLDADTIHQVLQPKLQGAWHLHQATLEHPLQHFVLFSSAAALFGNAGQSMYAAANAGMDALAEFRVAQGRPGLSIQWGAWMQTGKTRELTINQRLADDSLLIASLPPAQGMSALARLILARESGTVAVTPMRWHNLPVQFADAVPPLLENFAGSGVGSVSDAVPTSANPVALIDGPELSGFSTATPSQRRQILQQFIASQVMHLLATADAIDIHRSLLDYGLDSLMSSQLQARLREQLGIEISIRNLFDHASVFALTEFLLAQHSAGSSVPIPLADRSATLPLSHTQLRMWFLDRLQPDCAFYNMPVALRLSGSIDIACVQKSLDCIVARHEILRTRFPVVDEQPVQLIEAGASCSFVMVDLKHLAPQQQSAAVAQYLREEAQCPFDISQGPLLRAALLDLGEQNHRQQAVLSVNMHHIVSDGWSLGVLLHEFALHYRALVHGDNPSPPPLLLQFADYSLWQRTAADPQRLQQDLAFWHQQLAGLPAMLTLPTDHPRPPQQSFRGGMINLEWDAELLHGLERLSASQDATLFMTLAAAFSLLLSRYSGCPDIAVGSTYANRTRPELEPLIGFFANTWVLRTRPLPSLSFSGFLSQVREATLAAYEHQTVPFDQVVDILAPERSLAYSPLVQVMFILQNSPLAAIELPGIDVTREAREFTSSKFDITVSLEKSANGLLGWVEYSSDLFERETVVQLLSCFRRVLQQVVNAPHTRLDALQLVAVDTPHAGEDSVSPQNSPTLLSCVSAIAREMPHGQAWCDEAFSFSFAELERMLGRARDYLAINGMEAGATAGLVTRQAETDAFWLLAALTAGVDVALFREDEFRDEEFRNEEFRETGFNKKECKEKEFSNTVATSTASGGLPRIRFWLTPSQNNPQDILQLPLQRLQDFPYAAGSTTEGRVYCAGHWHDAADILAGVLQLQCIQPLQHGDGVHFGALRAHIVPAAVLLWPWCAGATVQLDPFRSDVTVRMNFADKWVPRRQIILGSQPADLDGSKAHRVSNAVFVPFFPGWAQPLLWKVLDATPLHYQCCDQLMLVDAGGNRLPDGTDGVVAVRRSGPGQIRHLPTGLVARKIGPDRLALPDLDTLPTIIGGVWIDPAGITASLLRDAQVEDACVRIARSAVGAPLVVLYVQSAAAIDPVALLQRCRLHLPACHLQALPRLPRLPSGHIDYSSLKKLPLIDSAVMARYRDQLLQADPAASVELMIEPAPLQEDVLHLDAATSRVVERLLPPLEFFDDASLSPRPAYARGEPLSPPDDFPADLVAALFRTAQCYPDHGITFIDVAKQQKKLGYRDLLAQAQCCLGGLQWHKLAPGDHVVLQFVDPQQLLLTFWACLLGGIVPVNIAIPTRYAADNAVARKLVHACNTLGAAAILTDQRQTDPLVDVFTALDVRIPCLLRYAELVTVAHFVQVYSPSPEDVAFIQLSSGSTGASKCIQIRHAGVIHHVMSIMSVHQYTAQDVTLNWLPMDHVVPMLMFHLKDVCVGMHQVQVAPAAVLDDPLLWLDTVHAFRVNHTWSPNFGFKLLADAARQKGGTQHWDLGCLRQVVNAGEQVTRAALAAFSAVIQQYGAPAHCLQPAFGMAEVCTVVTAITDFHLNRCALGVDKQSLAGGLRFTATDDSRVVEFVSMGKPIPAIELRIVDEQHQPLNEGYIGTLQVRGPVVTPGYYNNTKANAETLADDGWLHTGDLGYLWQGELFITGRHQEMIVINGVNFYCHEIEECLHGVEGVTPTLAAAVEIRHPQDATAALAVFLVPDAVQSDLIDVALIQRVRQALAQAVGITPHYVVPLSLEDFPRTTSGKIQRGQLRQRLESGELQPVLAEIDKALRNERTLPHWFFAPHWAPVALQSTPLADSAGPVLLVEQCQDLGRSISLQCHEQGIECLRITPSARFGQQARWHYSFDLKNPRHWQQLVQALPGWQWQTVTVLQVTDAVVDPGAKQPGLNNLLVRMDGLVKAIDAMATGLPRVQQVTLLSLTDGSAPTALAVDQVQAGVLQALRSEYPALRLRHLICDSHTVENNADWSLGLFSQLPDLKLHNGQWQQPQLQRCLPGAGFASPANVPDADSICLVTGGLGGVGTAVCQWLLQSTGATVVVVGRSDPSRNDHARLALQQLRDGCQRPRQMLYVEADITDQEKLQRALTAQGVSNGDVSHVFHLAGTASLDAADTLTPQHWSAAFNAKCLGAMILHQLLAGSAQAPVFVHFSSVNAFFGGAQATTYSAANAFLGQFARWQRDLGYNSLCLHWSQWQNAGISAQFTDAQRLLIRRRGYGQLTASQGIHSLELVLRNGWNDCLVGLDPRMDNVRRYLGFDSASGFALNSFVTHSRPSAQWPPAQWPPLLDRLRREVRNRVHVLDELPLTREGHIDLLRIDGGVSAQASGKRTLPRTTLERSVADVWKSLLGTGQVYLEDNFFELGGHSLLVAQLSSRLYRALGIQVPLRALFEVPTLGGMAGMLGAVCSTHQGDNQLEDTDDMEEFTL